MRVSIPLLLALSLVSGGATESNPEPQYEGSLFASTYSGGYFVNWDIPRYSRVSIYGPGEKPAYSALIEHRFLVWTIDSDGTAARAFQLHRPSHGESCIDLLDATGNATLNIKTGYFSAQHLAFAPDHTLWAAGYDDKGEDFNVLRHYSRAGEELGQGLPWSKIAGEFDALGSLQLILGGQRLFVGQDRIGFDVHLQHGHSTWVEVGLDGNLRGAYGLGPYRVLSYNPAAITASGGVYARISKDDRFDGYAVFDRSKEVWHKVTGYPEGRRIGSDGENLIFMQQDGGWTVIHSVPSGSLKVAKDFEGDAMPHQLRAALRMLPFG